MQVAKLAELCDTATGEDPRAAKQVDVVLIPDYTDLPFAELTGLDVEDVDLAAPRRNDSGAAGADMKLLQVTMGRASIMVTAHTYADLYDSDLDRVADALDGLGD